MGPVLRTVWIGVFGLAVFLSCAFQVGTKCALNFWGLDVFFWDCGVDFRRPPFVIDD